LEIKLYQASYKNNKKMVKKISLNAELRSEKENNKTIRKDGFTPAIIYGKGQENINIKLKSIALEKAYFEAGESSLVDLKLGDKNLKIIIKDVQKDVLKDNIIHADFYLIDVNTPLEVDVPLVFVNESKAVRELNGILSKNKETILVKCLPNDLLHEIEIDISVLENIHDAIKVRDIKVPESVHILDSLDDLVVNVIEPRKQEETKKEEETEEPKSEDKKEEVENKEEDKK